MSTTTKPTAVATGSRTNGELLVDTSVWSLALRRKDAVSLSPDEQKLKAELVQAIQDGRVAMLGLIRQELLSGIKERSNSTK